MSRSPTLVTMFMVTVLALTIAVSFSLDRPPAASGFDAPLDQFSAGRAWVHIQTMAGTAHPTGSAAQQVVRDYVLAQLHDLGLSPEVQQAVGVARKYPVAGSLENIVARIHGTSGRSEALALVAHYDSVPAGPGAADDGAGVATLLETARALVRGPKLLNDIILLFTDSEESGLLGASAFIDEHPWARDVRLALNFDVRGSSGNAWLFETSAHNGTLIREWARVSRYRVGASLTDEVYKRMPNDTDMTVFKAASIPILNFAFVDGWERYHTPLDRPELIDPRSLQHLGSYALPLAKRFAALDLTKLEAPDAIYFSLPGGWVLRYPAALAPVFAFLITLVFMAVVLQVARRGLLLKRRMAAGALLAIGSVVVAMLVGYLCGLLVRLLHAHLIHDGQILFSGLYSCAMALLTFAVLIGVQRLFASERWQISTSLGQMTVWIIALWILSFTMRGASYLLFVPMVLSLPAIALTPGRWPFRVAIIAGLAIPILLIFAPLEHALFTLFGFSMIGSIVIAAVLALALSLLTAQWNFIHRPTVIAAVSAACGVVLMVVAGFTVRYSPQHPSRSIQMYVLDADSHETLWVNDGEMLDHWSRDFFGPDPQRSRVDSLHAAGFDAPLFVHDAPPMEIPAAEVTVISSEMVADNRSLTLHVTSPRHARRLGVYAAASRIRRARIAGHELPGAPRGKEFWQMMYINVPVEGIDLQLLVDGNAPVKIEVVDRSEGLPSVQGRPPLSRPADSISYVSGDMTMTHRSFTF